MLISIIIPVYNHAHTLRAVFASILSQTVKDIEIIVINDGSTDDFSGAMKNILLNSIYKNLKIKVIEQENGGAPVARNRGFRESSGEYVIFWDADTIADSNMLQKMLQALQNNPTVSYAYSGFKFGWKIFKSQKFDKEKLKQVNYIDVTSLLRRMDFPGFDESLKKFQDWDLWLNLLQKNKTGVFIPEILYRKIVSGRVGISQWLPKCFYRLPFKTKTVKKYDKWKEIVLNKYR
jgi:glycosyltransferase involved in cell wall biosynthesis